MRTFEKLYYFIFRLDLKFVKFDGVESTSLCLELNAFSEMFRFARNIFCYQKYRMFDTILLKLACVFTLTENSRNYSSFMFRVDLKFVKEHNNSSFHVQN